MEGRQARPAGFQHSPDSPQADFKMQPLFLLPRLTTRNTPVVHSENASKEQEKPGPRIFFHLSVCSDEGTGGPVSPVQEVASLETLREVSATAFPFFFLDPGAAELQDGLQSNGRGRAPSTAFSCLL